MTSPPGGTDKQFSLANVNQETHCILFVCSVKLNLVRTLYVKPKLYLTEITYKKRRQRRMLEQKYIKGIWKIN